MVHGLKPETCFFATSAARVSPADCAGPVACAALAPDKHVAAQSTLATAAEQVVRGQNSSLDMYEKQKILWTCNCHVLLKRGV